MFFQGYTMNLIKWAARLKAEEKGNLSRVVVKAAFKRHKNHTTLRGAYGFDPMNSVNHSNVKVSRDTCGCELCKITREKVILKLTLHKIKVSYESDGIRSSLFDQMYANIRENKSQNDYYAAIREDFKSRIAALDSRKQNMVAAICHLKEL